MSPSGARPGQADLLQLLLGHGDALLGGGATPRPRPAPARPPGGRWLGRRCGGRWPQGEVEVPDQVVDAGGDQGGEHGGDVAALGQVLQGEIVGDVLRLHSGLQHVLQGLFPGVEGGAVGGRDPYQVIR